MTDKLYCPWCGEELSNDFGVIFCYNEDCEIYGCELNERVIRDIINGKKAQDALKKIATDSPLVPASMQLQEQSWHKHYDRLKDIACTAITSITKQEE